MSHTCQYSINRIKAGAADYKSIIGSGNKYTDNSFPANSEMISWSDFPRSDSGGLSSYVTSCTYKRISDFYPNNKLFNQISTFDIYQGRLANCYWITATSAVAGIPSRMEDVFLTDA